MSNNVKIIKILLKLFHNTGRDQETFFITNTFSRGIWNIVLSDNTHDLGRGWECFRYKYTKYENIKFLVLDFR